MLANSMSPPGGGTSRASSSEPIAVLAVLRVQASTDVGALIVLLANLLDLRVLRNRLEGSMDVDRRREPIERQVLYRCPRLVPDVEDLDAVETLLQHLVLLVRPRPGAVIARSVRQPRG